MNKEVFDRKYLSGYYVKSHRGKRRVVNCQTKNLVNEFLELASKFGYDTTDLENAYDNCKEKTCFDIKDNGIVFYGNLDFFKKEDYEIVEFKPVGEILSNDEIKFLKNFKFDDLVKREYGDCFLFLNGKCVYHINLNYCDYRLKGIEENIHYTLEDLSLESCID